MAGCVKRTSREVGVQIHHARRPTPWCGLHAGQAKEERDLVKGYNLGANSYIQKPVDFDQFRDTVKQVGLYWLLINQPPVAKPVAQAAGQTT